MRLPFMKKFNIEEFEFSQSYLFFWDKVRHTVTPHIGYGCGLFHSFSIIIILVHVGDVTFW